VPVGNNWKTNCSGLRRTKMQIRKVKINKKPTPCSMDFIKKLTVAQLVENRSEYSTQLVKN